MANITRRGERWRASVYKYGRRKTATFDSKTEAKLWANQTELELERLVKKGNMTPLCEVIIRFRDEIASKKRGFYTERYVIERLAKQGFAQKPISMVTPQDIAAFRDSGSRSDGTVNKEMKTLQTIFRVAMNEWELIDGDPVAKVRKPSPNKPRDRRILPQEIEDIAEALGWSPALKLKDIAALPAGKFCAAIHKDIAQGFPQKRQRGRKASVSYMFQLAVAFLLAIETGMRRNEILKLTWDTINLPMRTAYLPLTKNSDSRTVPLTQTAIRLLEQLRIDGRNELFDVPADYVTHKLHEVTKRLGIENLHFHDTRHEAVTRLARKLNVLDLARVIGHRNISQLMTYYNKSVEDIAKELD